MKVMISDVIVPELFAAYVINRTAELSAFVQSGIIVRDPQFDALANGAGSTVNMPFWNDLSGDDEVLSDSGSLTPGKIDSGKDIAATHNRGRAWSTNDLAGLLAGSDPMAAIGNRVAAYWARRQQAFLLSSLAGVFSAASMSDSIHSIFQASGSQTDANELNGNTMIDAGQKLGDAKSVLTAISMHSQTEASLAKQDLIDFTPDSEGKWTVKTFQGLRVIIDDGMPVETVDGKQVYTSYLFGGGAFGYGEKTDAMPIEGGFGDWYVETARAPLAGDNYLINRRRFVMHPRGVKWTSTSVAGVTPTNTELATASNWNRVYATKNIRVVKVKHNNA